MTLAVGMIERLIVILTVIPVDMIMQVIDGVPKTKLLTWLAAPAGPFYVMHIAGSWFSHE